MIPFPARCSTLFVLAVGALSGCRPAPLAPPPPPAVGFQLRDVGSALGLNYRYDPGAAPPLNILEIMGGGAAFLDFDGDGWLDVLCVGQPHPALYRNERGQRFVDVTAASGLGRQSARWFGCATGDYDNDGRVDLLLTGYQRSALFRNRGDGTFADVTATVGLNVPYWATSAAFADVNHDGRLDLYVACYADFKPGMPEFTQIQGVSLSLGPDAYAAQRGLLFLNDGARFRDATRASGLAEAHGKGLGVAFADPDQDGDDDLVVANDQQPLDYFENDGHGRFRSVSLENGTAFSSEGRRQGGMGLSFGDYDGDLRLDLFVANFADEPKSLYHNLGHGMYAAAGTQAGVSQTTRPWVAFGTSFADLNHDGQLDLALVNGHVQDAVQQVDRGNSYPQKPQLFLNSGGGRFREASAGVGPDFQRPLVGRALATGDFDNDGDLDLLAADLGGSPRLYQNEGGNQAGHWLMLQLTGSASNRQAVGARVEVTAGELRLIREVRTDGSYLSASDPRLHFGLGKAQQVDVLKISWPSGRQQTLRNVAANQLLRVVETNSGL